MSHPIAKQVHEKFKVFAGELAADRTIGKLATEVADFVARGKVAAKSIGIVHVEHSNRIVITLGYRDDEAAYPITLHSLALGRIEGKGNDFSMLEEAISKATTKHDNIICHELYMPSPNEFMMVLMTHGA